jgi:hypothetical protein
MQECRMGTGTFLGKEVVLVASGRAGEKSDLFNRLQERLTRFPKEESNLEEARAR